MRVASLGSAGALLAAAAEALRRKDGSLLLGYEKDMPSARDAARMVGLPVSVFNGMILAALKIPKLGRTATGELAKIVTWHDGTYFDIRGRTFREKDLEWIVEEPP